MEHEQFIYRIWNTEQEIWIESNNKTYWKKTGAKAYKTWLEKRYPKHYPNGVLKIIKYKLTEVIYGNLSYLE